MFLPEKLVFHAHVPLKVKLGSHISVSAVITIDNKCVKGKCLLKGRRKAVGSSSSVFLLGDMIVGAEVASGPSSMMYSTLQPDDLCYQIQPQTSVHFKTRSEPKVLLELRICRL